MNPPAVVVFDLGKVLVDYDYGIASRRLLRRTRLTDPECGTCFAPRRCCVNTKPARSPPRNFTRASARPRDTTAGWRSSAPPSRTSFTEIEAMTALHAAVARRRNSDLDFFQHQRTGRAPHPQPLPVFLPFRRLCSFLRGGRDEARPRGFTKWSNARPAAAAGTFCIWTTARKMWPPAWPAAGAPCCMRRRRKRGAS